LVDERKCFHFLPLSGLLPSMVKDPSGITKLCGN